MALLMPSMCEASSHIFHMDVKTGQQPAVGSGGRWQGCPWVLQQATHPLKLLLQGTEEQPGLTFLLHPALNCLKPFFHIQPRSGITAAARNKQTSGTKCKRSTSVPLVPRQFSQSCHHRCPGSCYFHFHTQDGWEVSAAHCHGWVDGSHRATKVRKSRNCTRKVCSHLPPRPGYTVLPHLVFLISPRKGLWFSVGKTRR